MRDPECEVRRTTLPRTRMHRVAERRGRGPDYIEPNPWWGYPQEGAQDTEDDMQAGPGNDDIYMGYLDETVDHVDCGEGTDWVWQVTNPTTTEDTFVNCENIGD